MILYLLISLVFALTCILWNIIALVMAIRRRKEITTLLLLVYVLTLPAALLGYVADIAGTGAWMPGWLWIAWIYPASFLVSAYAGIAVWRIVGKRWWLLSIPLWNLAIGIVLTVRFLTYLGVDCGISGGAILTGYAMVQTAIVFPLYIFFPFINPLPVLMLPTRSNHSRLSKANLVPAVLTGLLLIVMSAVLPHAWYVTSSWRASSTPMQEIPSHFQLGAVLRTTQKQAMPDWRIEQETAAMESLNLDAANFFVYDNLMRDPIAADALGRLIHALKERDVTVILTADFPEDWGTKRIEHPDLILEAMLPFHEFLAKTYQPDILVPFIEPYGAFALVTGQRYDAEVWVELLHTVCQRIRDVAPGVQCAVYFCQTEEDRLLYKKVCEENSPVDVVGFSIYSIFQPRRELDERLATLTEWMTNYGTGKPHWLFETGQSPLTMGGEQAQAGFVDTILNWAIAQSDIQGVCIFSLRDYIEQMGLLASGGRPRKAWYVLQNATKDKPLVAIDSP